MKVVCGLGNPGEKYLLTRHNVGFRVVDLLADRWGVNQGRVRDGAARLEVIRDDPVGRVLLVKPARFMNMSGAPLRSAVRSVDADPETDLLVVTDDADLPLGRIRLRRSGSAGGHNGLRDIIEVLGTDQFARLRVGIGRNGEMVDHVLSTFSKAEKELAQEAIATAADAVEAWLAEGIEAAMNVFNGVDLDEPPSGAVTRGPRLAPLIPLLGEPSATAVELDVPAAREQRTWPRGGRPWSGRAHWWSWSRPMSRHTAWRTTSGRGWTSIPSPCCPSAERCPSSGRCPTGTSRLRG